MFSKENRANTIHGILLIALFSFAAFYIAEIPFVKSLSFSPLIVGIILGMLYANSLRNKLPETWVPGIKFCTKQILRAGIVLYGFRLTLTQVAAVGLPAVVIDTIIVAGTIFLGVWLGTQCVGRVHCVTRTGHVSHFVQGTSRIDCYSRITQCIQHTGTVQDGIEEHGDRSEDHHR